MPRVPGRHAVVAALIVAVGVPSIAIGAGEGRSLILGERNPRGGADLGRETEVIAASPTYGTRQSNVRDNDGGGAIYGCRSAPGNEPCVRSNNLRNGRAFEFETKGREGGFIQTGDPNGAPFATNATGVAPGLNADRVDGRQGSDLLGRTERAADANRLDGRESVTFANRGDFRFLRVQADGDRSSARGVESVSRDGNVYVIDFDRNLNACTFTATQSTPADPQENLSVAQGGEDDRVRVTVTGGDGAAGFHLQVIC